MTDDEDEDEDDVHEQYDGFRSAYRRAYGSRGDVRWPDRSKGEMLDSFDGDDVYGEEELMHDSYDGGGFDYGPGYRLHNVDFSPAHGGASTNWPGTGVISLTRPIPTLPLALLNLIFTRYH